MLTGDTHEVSSVVLNKLDTSVLPYWARRAENADGSLSDKQMLLASSSYYKQAKRSGLSDDEVILRWKAFRATSSW